MTKMMDAALENFKELYPDDYEYIILLSNEIYGWSTLSSGKRIYIAPPATTAKEAGNALRTIIKRINESKSQEEEVKK